MEKFNDGSISHPKEGIYINYKYKADLKMARMLRNMPS
jgi:hypothetical protein